MFTFESCRYPTSCPRPEVSLEDVSVTSNRETASASRVNSLRQLKYPPQADCSQQEPGQFLARSGVSAVLGRGIHLGHLSCFNTPVLVVLSEHRPPVTCPLPP